MRYAATYLFKVTSKTDKNMAWRILEQKDGKLALWSTIVDDLLGWNGTPDEIQERITENMVAQAKRNSVDVFQRMLKNREPLSQSYIDQMIEKNTLPDNLEI